MRQILSLMVIPFYMVYAHAGYLSFPIDDLQNLTLSSQILEKILTEKTEDSFYLGNPEFFGYERVEIDVLASKIDLKNHVRSFKALMTREKLAENDFRNAFMKGIISLNQIDSGDWEIALKDTTSRRKTTFKLTNLSGGDNPFGISIILPTFNRITECTACVLLLKARILAPKNQWEVIVVADGCTDGTGMHFENLFKQKGFDNFRVIWTDKEPGKYRNAGWPENSGVRAAKYSHVSLCDCDIYHLCDPITPSLRHLATDQETMIGGKLYCISSPKAMHDAYAPEMILEKYKWQEFCEAGWLVIKREHYLRIGGSSEKLMNWGCEDTDLITRLKKLGLGIRYVDEIIYVLGNEFRSDHKQNPKELGKLNLSVLKADGELVRNQDKPDWGKYFTQPVYPEQEPDFSKVN